MTNYYSLGLNLIISFGDDAPILPTTYHYENTKTIVDYQSTGLLLNTDIENNQPFLPERELKVSKGEEFLLHYQAGGYEDCKELAIIISIGFKAATINNQNYLLCSVQNNELVSGIATLKAPEEAGEYELMG